MDINKESLFHNGLKMDKKFNYALEYLLHGLNVANLGLVVAEELNLNEIETHLLYYGGMFHDLGKSLISEDILFKPGRPTDDEWETIKLHPYYSSILVDNFITYNVDKKNRLLFRYLKNRLPQVVLFHHENVDGSGYPVGLKGSEIPTLSKILRIIDIFDSLLADRIYRKRSYTIPEAISILDRDCENSIIDKKL